MARKNAAPPAAPIRRSARLASRSPSAERDTVSQHQMAMAPSQKTPEPPKRAIRRGEEAFTPLLTEAQRAKLLEGNTMPPSPPKPPRSSSSSSTMRKLRLREIQRVGRQLSEEEAAPPSPPSPPGAPPQQEAPLAVAPAAPSPPPPTSAERAAEQPRAGWLQMLSTFSGYLTSPFTRKRPAEEPAELPPSPKRSRQEEHTEISQATQPAQYLGDEPQSTPRPLLTPRSPRDYTGPSTKNPKMPTSLSTITEYTEPSLLSNFSQSVLEGTPSRPPREQPQNSLLQVPQSTPIRRPSTTPTMRRSAQLRAARAAGMNTPNTGFTMRTAIPKPRESNADARLAKLERMRTLQRELEELEQDEDVKEMQSHRLKRVKIDNLVEIPHNRPGDPSGCFRVPEEDSDDEMEVYENVEERSNLFEEMNTEAEDVTMQEEQNMEPTDTSMAFSFPDVGPVPEGYYVSEEFKEEAGRLFEAGLVEFLAA